MFRKYTLLILLLMLAVSLPVSATKEEPHKFTVVLDAGHGGKDVGASENGVHEKDINLGVALKAGDMISKKLKDVKVVYTRNDDRYLTLQERADVANKAKGDLFISIHTNSVDRANKNRESVAGASVYALGLHKDQNNMAVARRENAVIELESDYQQKYSGFNPLSDESYIIFELVQKGNLSRSIKFAKAVQNEFVKTAGRVDRGVHQAGFWVLWATSMPAVLVELDFICNPVSAEFLKSGDGQKKLAESIFNAVRQYTSTGLQEVALEENKPVVEPENEVMQLTATTTVKKTEAPITASVQQAATGKRRRRTEAAKVASDNRDVAIESIHLSSERTIEPEEVKTKTVETAAVQNKSERNESTKPKVRTEKKVMATANSSRPGDRRSIKSRGTAAKGKEQNSGAKAKQNIRIHAGKEVVVN